MFCERKNHRFRRLSGTYRMEPPAAWAIANPMTLGAKMSRHNNLATRNGARRFIKKVSDNNKKNRLMKCYGARYKDGREVLEVISRVSLWGQG
ncbi:hypothetical protein TNCV_4895571 [Trichonephila clavipes]|nr:hypothetical protein TNCV_4895571 [Trichonephila clavipes]